MANADDAQARGVEYRAFGRRDYGGVVWEFTYPCYCKFAPVVCNSVV